MTIPNLDSYFEPPDEFDPSECPNCGEAMDAIQDGGYQCPRCGHFSPSDEDLESEAADRHYDELRDREYDRHSDD